MSWNIETIERILQYTSTYGLAFVFLFFFLVGISWVFYEIVKYVRKWAPLIVEKHIKLLDTFRDFMDFQTENNARMADAIEVLSRSKSEYDHKTHKVLRHFAFAAKGASTQDEVRVHINAAIEELMDK